MQKWITLAQLRQGRANPADERPVLYDGDCPGYKKQAFSNAFRRRSSGRRTLSCDCFCNSNSTLLGERRDSSSARCLRRNFMPLRWSVVHAQAHPDQMRMIWHEDIYRAKQTFPCGGMQEEFAEMQVKTVIEPASGPAFQGYGPVNNSETAIKFRCEPREMMPVRLLCERTHAANRIGFR